MCATRFKGKLNGAIATTTPQGTRKVNPNLPSESGAPSKGIVSPYNRFASSEDPVIVWIALEASNLASGSVFPSSNVIIRANSSWRSVSMSAALRRSSYPVSYTHLTLPTILRV